MKKGNVLSVIVYLLAAAFNIIAIIGFATDMDGSMPSVFLCLGSSFLCLGSVFLSRAGRAEGDAKDKKNDVSDNANNADVGSNADNADGGDADSER